VITFIFGLVAAVCFAHLLYVYGGYVQVLKLVAKMRGRSDRADRDWPTPSEWPTMTIYIGAKDEADIIEARLENCIDTTYPLNRLEIIVVADGCADDTEAISRRFAAAHPDLRCRIVVHETSQGKWWAQNHAATDGFGDILVSTDAETIFEPETLARLAAPFSDPSVGVVGGRVVYLSPDTAVGDSYNTYRSMEHHLRRFEMANGILMKSDGPCVAYRRKIWQEIEPFEDVDHVVCYFSRDAGLESVYEPAAVAYDRANETRQQDVRQRSRMTRKFFLANGKLQTWSKRLRDPAFAWAIYSHRTARLLSPVWLVVGGIAGLTTIGRLSSLALFAAFGAAIVGGLVIVAVPKLRDLAVAFAAAQAGFALGLWQFLAGRDRTGRYTPTRQIGTVQTS